MESSIKVEERAAAWLAKRDSGEWSEDDERQLQVWLDASVANTVAFVRLEAVWTQAARLKALSSRPGHVPPPNTWQLSPFFEQRDAPEPGAVSPVSQWFSRRAYLAAAAIAMIVVTAAISWYVFPLGPTYSTPVGGMAAVPMNDGSRVILNTDSEIHLAVTEKERRVELRQGEAFFEVAKDPQRPFVVQAGDKRVIAVGTKFSVRRNGSDVRVFVTEGKVRFEDDSIARSSPPHESLPGPATPGPGTIEPGTVEPILIAAGSMARTADAGILIQKKSLADIEDYLSWRSGYLTFNEAPLADAIAEFNRYNEQKILIQDPQVAAIRLSGKFRSTQFEAFVHLLEEGFPVRAQHVDGQIILTDASNAQQSTP